MKNTKVASIVAIENENGTVEYTELLKSQAAEDMAKTLLHGYNNKERIAQLIHQCGFKTCKKSFELLGLCPNVYLYDSQKDFWWKNTIDHRAWVKLDDELKAEREITNLFKNFSHLCLSDQDFFIEKMLLDTKTTNALIAFLNKNSYLKNSLKK